jgi:hypothetical protein
VSEFKYIRTILTNQNYINEGNRRLNVESDCYHSIQNLLSKNRNIKIYNIAPISVPICMGLKLGLSHFRENRVLGRTLGLNREEVLRNWRKLYNEEHYNRYYLPNIMMSISQRSYSMHGREEKCMEVLVGKP